MQSCSEHAVANPADAAPSDDVAALLHRVETAEKQRDAALAEIEKLRAMLKQLQRRHFGARSEQLDPDQLHLALEDQEQSQASVAAQEEAAGEGNATDGTNGSADQGNTAAAKSARSSSGRRPARNRGALPSHLPRVEETIDVPHEACPCCGGTMHKIDETVEEQLDILPAQFRVKVIRRPKYGCRSCAEAVVQAPAPPRPIDGGMATEALVAHVVVSKYGDHLPLYRQAGMYARQGISLDRSTLADWVGRACWWLEPLYQLLITTVLSSAKIFADDTPIPVLDPGRGRTKTGRIWAYARDDRPWQGPLPPAIVYVYGEDRRGAHPAAHLKTFSGLLQVDGYQAYKSIAMKRKAGDGTIILVFCWAHTRRKFYDVHKSTDSPIALDILKRIARLYEIEDDIRGQPPDERKAVRQAKSRPIVEALKTELDAQSRRVSRKSPLGEAIAYALAHWEGLTLFLDDGRLEMDTNTVERGMRPVKLSAKNHLFAGSDSGGRHWAIAASLIETCRLNGIDPEAYLRDVLERIVSGEIKATELQRLLPWHWQSERRARTGAVETGTIASDLPVAA